MKKFFCILIFSFLFSFGAHSDVYADPYKGDFAGWFDNHKSFSSNFVNFNKIIDNNLSTSVSTSFTQNVTFNSPLYLESIVVSGLRSNMYLDVYYIGSSSRVRYEFGVGSHIFRLDTTRTVSKIEFMPYGEYAEFDVIAVSNFYLNAFSPANGRIDVALDEKLSGVFNEGISKAGTIVVTDSNGNSIDGKISFSGSSFDFIPLKNFSYGSKYSVSISNFIGSSGDEMKDFNSSFTTVKDTIPISVIDIKPPPDSVDVPVDTTVEITFNKKNIDVNTFKDVYIDGVNISKLYSNGILYLIIKEPLEYSKEYFIHIDGVCDTLGNTMKSPVDVKFSTIKDTTGLVLKSYKPPGGIYPLDTKIEFNFNKNVDSRTLKYSLIDSDGNTVSCSVNVVGTKITFTPILVSSKKYTFVFSEIKDFNENVYSTPITIKFETMRGSGEKDFDTITSDFLNVISWIKEHGLIIVLGAILLGLIFITSKWLWKKLKIWLSAS